MPNPFVYGEVVPGEAFVDREVELDRLIGDLAGGQKVFLISPRRYGKSSLVRQALDGLARRGALTVEVTVSSYSSYMAFLEGYARALASLETKWDRARSWLSERHPDHAARAALRAEGHRPRPRVGGVSAGAHRSRRQPAGQRDLRDAGPGGRGAQAAGRRGARRVPGHRGVQRRQRRARAPRRGAAPAPGGLRVRRLRAEPDGEDDRAAPAVLQGRPGHPAREDPGRRLRRLHRAPLRQERHQAGAGAGRGDRGPGRQPALRRAAAGARDLGRRARRRRQTRRPRAPARHA